MPFDVIIGRAKKEREKLGKKGVVFIGKQYVRMGQVTSLSNEVFLDVANAHVVLIVGKRGCLVGDTKIFTNHGYKELKDFDPPRDLVYSYNGKNFEWENAALLKYDLEEESLIFIENYDGQTLVMTQEHPLLVLENGKKIWKEAKYLKIGDLLLSTTQVPEVRKDKESLRIARLLGFMLADGTMQARKGIFKDGRGYLYNGTKRRVRLVNKSNDVLQTAKSDLEEEFDIVAKLYKKGAENCYVVETKQGKVLEKLNSLGVPLGLKSHLIRVPSIVFESSNEFKRCFLAALFSCDGYVDKEGRNIIYYSKSKRFLEDLHLILSHFNIQSTIRDKIARCNGKYFEHYQLSITDHTSLENFKKIGFVHKEKEVKLGKHKFWRAMRRKGTKYINENLFGNKITNIALIEGKEPVYDLRVPKNHSFIANGVISHNSGKSYTMGVIAEGVANLPDEVKNNIAVVLLDTMGIYWTMKYKNDQDEQLLRDWGLEGEGLDVKIYTPIGYYNEYKEKGIPTDYPFSIRPNELDSIDWCLTFEVDPYSQMGVLIQKAINSLKESGKNYPIDDIIKEIAKDKTSLPHIRDAVSNLFINAKAWGLFDVKGTEIRDIVKGGQVTVLDMSAYATMAAGWGVKSLAIGLIAQKLFVERMIARKFEEYEEIHATLHYFGEEKKKKAEFPMVWLVIDEAHEFLPAEGKTAATSALITILREGRQPGISLILATQQPGKIHSDVLTQADTVIAHRITAKVDVDALGTLMQSYMREGLVQQLDNLPGEKGSAIVFDDTNERMYPMKVRPRFTWHGGSAPSALKEEKEGF